MAVKTYDQNNIFARILRGEIPCRKVAENDHALAFHDINPLAPTHVLVIPKGPYVDIDHFSGAASEPEIVSFVRLVGEVARLQGIDEAGFRILANTGTNGHQEVPHLHIHVFGGRPLGPMLKKID